MEDSLEELGQLARTAGAQVVGVMTQHLDRPSPKYLGKGKLEELRELRQALGAGTVVFDDELSPTQQKSLEEALGEKVLDRTALILDVFARHAQTREGRLQVELAQHEYLLPRLVGQWSHLERLGGGIGTRGPGESQLETDRRLIGRRIQRLKAALEAVRQHRARYRARRQHDGVPVVSLVGYTNAGKSSLLNALSGAGVTVRDQPFSTLDPVTRRILLPGGETVLLTDTVGFIHKLPPALIAAFRATIEEIQESDILLHVVDISHRNVAQQAEVVDQILHDMGLDNRPRVLALNKADLLLPSPRESAVRELANALHATQERSVIVSALKGWGLDRLRATLEDVLRDMMREPPRPAARHKARTTNMP